MIYQKAELSGEINSNAVKKEAKTKFCFILHSKWTSIRLVGHTIA